MTEKKHIQKKYEFLFCNMDLDFNGYIALKKLEKQEIDNINPNQSKSWYAKIKDRISIFSRFDNNQGNKGFCFWNVLCGEFRCCCSRGKIVTSFTNYVQPK